MAKSFTITAKEPRTPHEFELVLPPLPVPVRQNSRSRAKPIEPQPRVEKFHAHGTIPAWLMIEAEGLTAADGAEAARRYLAFFDAAIIPEDQARWRAVVRDPHNQIDAADLGPIFHWLYEVCAERPTPSA